jgi:hypothetical protein
VIYYEEITASRGHLQFGDCDTATCGSGTVLTVDGNKIINATLGDTLVNATFGSAAGGTLTWVSDTEYPSGGVDGTLGTGTYTLNLRFTNSITAGTLTWHYHVGYCTISSNCSTKTVHVSSADQSYTSATTSPQLPTVVAGSSLTIPAPTQTNWVYVEMHATAVATGTIAVRMNNTAANTADTYIDIPALTVPETMKYLLPLALFLPPILRLVVRGKHKKLAYAALT